MDILKEAALTSPEGLDEGRAAEDENSTKKAEETVDQLLLLGLLPPDLPGREDGSQETQSEHLHTHPHPHTRHTHTHTHPIHTILTSAHTCMDTGKVKSKHHIHRKTDLLLKGIARLFLAGNGWQCVLNESQKQLYPLRGAEDSTGVRRGDYTTKEPQSHPGVVLEGGHF